MIMLETIERKYFENAGVRLSYLDNNVVTNQPPIVMLHGFTASAETNWLKSQWITPLTDAGRRVIAIDARGHGESDKPYDNAYYPSDVMMEDSMTLLNQMGFESADYCGYSMGARMSTFAAIHYPEKVRKLLIGGMGINLKNGIGNAQATADALLAEDLALVKNRHTRRFRRLAEKGNNDLTALAHCILSSRQKITESSLAKIQAKTCIIVGARDDIGGNPHELSPYIPNSQAIEIADCNHFDALMHQQFRKAGLAFLLSE